MSQPKPTSPALIRLDARAIERTCRRRQQLTEAPWLHQEVARRMAERVSLIRQAPARVLDWSLDAGALSPALLQACPSASLQRVVPTATASSERQVWWRRLTRIGQREVQGLAESELSTASADMVWSNMALHFVAEPPERLRAWRAALAPEGFVMFSTIGPGSLGLLRDVYADSGWGPAHSPLVDMHDLGDMMVEAGFSDPVMDQEVVRLTYVSPERLLEELRGLGANLSPQRFAGLRTSAWRRRLLSALSERVGADGRIALEIELVYGHAFRAPDRGPAVSASTTIDLMDMKLMLRKSESRK